MQTHLINLPVGMCFCLNYFLVFLLNKRMNSCQVTFCNLIRFSHLESSDGSQPTKGLTWLLEMHFPGDHLSTAWRWHFAPFSLWLLEEEKRMTTKILVFLVLSWSDGVPASWSCMAEFLAWMWLWTGRCCCISKEEVATVTIWLVSFESKYRWTDFLQE